ncbi:MAG: sigma-54 dependent transcriptional regulator [Gemmatimonadales bacterium]
MSERVLVIEDDRELRELLLEVLTHDGYQAVGFPTAEAALRAIEADQGGDLVLTDLMLPGMSGRELVLELRRRRPELNVVVMTAFGSIDSAIELVKAGAFDYLTKPLATDELRLAVERALEESRRRRSVAQALQQDGLEAAGFVGASAPMRELLRLVARAAGSPHPVLIVGESGTGKELVARAVHRLSGRAAFVSVNCGALPDQLMESELFGHERGAFTGADRTKDGLFHVADKGTLFLDEIAELPMALQPKLLRALEHGEIRRVGGTQPIAVDVRVVAATHRDLEAEAEAGRFRSDLLWRLNVLTLSVPPLRERPSDIPLLAEHFLAATGEPDAAGSPPRRVSAEAMARLRSYPWPGNVRELRNTMLRAATMTSGRTIEVGDLPPRVADAGRAAALVAGAAERRLSLDDVERMYIEEVLRQAGGNKSRAAEILGLDRKTLYRKLEDYRSEPSPD